VHGVNNMHIASGAFIASTGGWSNSPAFSAITRQHLLQLLRLQLVQAHSYAQNRAQCRILAQLRDKSTRVVAERALTISVLDIWTRSYLISSCYGNEKLRAWCDAVP
jgi:hypothetical protein